ncbi:interferon alpha/beta receptor 1-like isoform X2 [Megalops cyprinoides]|uniref:interferon alpha/beta receptor 1-like isoform X2 n=1 Tax=Megalops cyprinoides TaxID=118141 RepID=UPI001864A56F|nr:interferon alpha/beta receptor 1-like isoform X2 [Megalops cyprinoides]
MLFKFMSCIFFISQGILRGVWTLLPAPENVIVVSENLHSELRWRPVQGNHIKYTVQYRIYSETEWQDIETCDPTAVERCNFTSAIRAAFNVTLRVRTQDGNQTSPWSHSKLFQAISQTRLGPPNVTLNTKHKLHVYITDPFHRTDFADNLRYRVSYWPENQNLTRSIDTLSPGVIDDVKVGVKYCVEVRYLYNHQLRNNDIPSARQCVKIPESEESRMIRILWVVAVAVAVAGVLMLGCVYGFSKDKLKQLLQPPLQPAGHIREFLMEEDHFLHLTESSTSTSSSDESFDKISLVTMNKEEEEQEDVPSESGQT